jgi:hypothetical protein
MPVCVLVLKSVFSYEYEFSDVLGLGVVLAAFVSGIGVVLGIFIGPPLLNMVSSYFVERIVDQLANRLPGPLQPYLRTALGTVMGSAVGLIIWLLTQLASWPTRLAPSSVQLFALRQFLERAEGMPGPAFLNFATDCDLLRSVGSNRYVFIHRLLLEHFANTRAKS